MRAPRQLPLVRCEPGQNCDRAFQETDKPSTRRLPPAALCYTAPSSAFRSDHSSWRATVSQYPASCSNLALVTASVAAAALAPHTRARRCSRAERAVISWEADDGRCGLRSMSDAIHSWGAAKEWSFFCSQPAQKVNALRPR